jgi:predicted DNA-binding transcriptional regulator YafY
VSLIVAVLRRLTASWYTVDKLAADLGVSRRTILRVLSAIRQEGLPLESERQGQSKIVAHRLKRRWTDHVRRGVR